MELNALFLAAAATLALAVCKPADKPVDAAPTAEVAAPAAEATAAPAAEAAPAANASTDVPECDTYS